MVNPSGSVIRWAAELIAQQSVSLVLSSFGRWMMSSTRNGIPDSSKAGGTACKQIYNVTYADLMRVMGLVPASREPGRVLTGSCLAEIALYFTSCMYPTSLVMVDNGCPRHMLRRSNRRPSGNHMCTE